MKWREEDIELYMKAREYVDTIVVPLVQIDLEKNLKNSFETSKWVLQIVAEVEKHLKGRVFEMIPFTYILHETETRKRLDDWINYFAENGFNHCFYVTFDRIWEGERDFEKNMIVLKQLLTEETDEITEKIWLEERVEEVVTFIKKQWESEGNES